MKFKNLFISLLLILICFLSFNNDVFSEGFNTNARVVRDPFTNYDVLTDYDIKRIVLFLEGNETGFSRDKYFVTSFGYYNILEKDKYFYFYVIPLAKHPGTFGTSLINFHDTGTSTYYFYKYDLSNHTIERQDISIKEACRLTDNPNCDSLNYDDKFSGYEYHWLFGNQSVTPEEDTYFTSSSPSYDFTKVLPLDYPLYFNSKVSRLIDTAYINSPLELVIYSGFSSEGEELNLIPQWLIDKFPSRLSRQCRSSSGGDCLLYAYTFDMFSNYYSSSEKGLPIIDYVDKVGETSEFLTTYYVDFYLYRDEDEEYSQGSSFNFKGIVGDTVNYIYDKQDYFGEVYVIDDKYPVESLVLTSNEEENHIKVYLTKNPDLKRDIYINYYFNNVLDKERSYVAQGYATEWFYLNGIPENIDDYYLIYYDSHWGNFNIQIKADEKNEIDLYYYTKDFDPESSVGGGFIDKGDYTDIKTDDKFYFFFDYNDLKELFPGINWSSFNQYQQFLILLVVNIFYLLFWAFIIYIVIKMLYKVFQLI